MSDERADDAIARLLALHLEDDEVEALGDAVAHLPSILMPDELPIRLTDARFDGTHGLLAITTAGVRFIGVDGDTITWLALADLRGARRVDPASQTIRVDTGHGSYRFDDLGGQTWPTECAVILDRLATLGPDAALDLAEEYEDDEPAPALDAETREALGRIGVAGVLIAGFLAVLWLFALSSVQLHDVDESVDCIENFGSVGAAFDVRCQAGQYNQAGHPTLDHDCGTVGGSLLRASFNGGNSLAERSLYRTCRSEALGSGVPIGLGLCVLALGGVWLVLRRRLGSTQESDQLRRDQREPTTNGGH